MIGQISHPFQDQQQVKLRRGGMAIFAAIGLVGAVLFSLSLDGGADRPYLFLMPWVLGLGFVMAVPLVILIRQGKFSFANPLVFATCSYFFPAFVIGGVVLSMSWSQPYFLDHIQDPEIDLPYTVLLVALGFSGLAFGYLLPIGQIIGEWIRKSLPTIQYPPRLYILPGLLLLGLGVLSVSAATFLGIAGYQVADQITSYDGLIIATTQFWMEGMFLLWLVIFRKGRWDAASYICAGVTFVTFLIRALFAGNRGSLLHFFVVVFMAYVLAGRILNIKQMISAGFLMILCVGVGMIYGTTFRNVKGQAGAVSVSEYTGSIFETFEQVGRNDSRELFELSSGALAERIDTLSSVAVVVSNYQKLAPFEEQYGLQDNILNDLTTFFIPRILWNDKPVASDARSYSELYFDYGQNSFAITPIGDLLRNFGPVGVPIGMLLLGLILRIFYAALIDVDEISPWRAAIYIVLLNTVSYESFYGLIIPTLVKNTLIAVIGISLVLFVAGRLYKSEGHIFAK
jgi:hypothetical protein